MGFLSSKEELCDICGSPIPKGDKLKLSDGIMCRACWCNSGINAILWNIKKLSVEDVKKGVADQTQELNQFEAEYNASGLSNPDISVDGFMIKLDTRKWLFMADPLQRMEVRDFDDVEDVWTDSIQSGGMQKDSSGALKRAIIGGVIAGPAGAIIGATTNKDKTSINLENKYIISLKLKGIEEAQSLLMSNKHNAEVVYNALTKDKVTPESTPSAASIPDKIREYKALFDEGIIDEEEFKEKKKALLSGTNAT